VKSKGAKRRVSKDSSLCSDDNIVKVNKTWVGLLMHRHLSQDPAKDGRNADVGLPRDSIVEASEEKPISRKVVTE